MNLETSAKIRRTVENVAHTILEDRPGPEMDYDGDMVEHWDLKPDELFEKVVWDIDWMEWEPEDEIDRMIRFHCEDFIKNGLEDMQEGFREGLREDHERKRYEASHQPQFKPKKTL